MISRIQLLEEALIDYAEGRQQPPFGLDTQEVVVALREELEEMLRQEARSFLEDTKDLTKDDQMASWRNWLLSSDGVVYPWRQTVFCELDTPTLPSPSHES